MKRAFARLLLVALVTLCAAASCKQLDVKWPQAVQCVAEPSAELITQVRTIVESDGFDAVFSSKATDALEDVARRYTPDLVACVLRMLLDGYTRPTGMAAPPDDLARARRVQHFFNEKDLEVRGRSETEP